MKEQNTLSNLCSKMPPGEEKYNTDNGMIKARGISYSETELASAIMECAHSIVWDSEGTVRIATVLAALAKTAFETDGIKRILQNNWTPESWRIGEAIAESYLIGHCQCMFPWPTGRDLRNPRSSPGGTDLVGFQYSNGGNGGHRFTFGEVKTSTQEKWPPSVVTGRHGLIKQIEGLMDTPKTKDNLVKYLAHHAIGSWWINGYQSAAKKYLANPYDVSLFGLLVRDVQPDIEDLKDRTIKLSTSCPADTTIELWAIYLPPKSIDDLPKKIAERHKEG